MTAKHIVIITFKPKSKNISEFINVLQTVKTQLPTVKGCLNVNVLRHSEDVDAFTIVEEWKEKEFHAAHTEKLIASGDWANIEQMLAEKPASQFLSPL